MLERIIKIMVSGQGNGCPPILDRGRILEMSEGVATFEFRKAHTARGSNIGLLWRPQPKAPPFGRGFYYPSCVGFNV